jgi:putative colanic acid biosynthesis acetyltransferase WcaF
VLKLFGAKIGYRSDVRGSAQIWLPANLTMGDRSILAEGVNCYNMAEIKIGCDVIISQRSHLCGGTHDFNDPNFQLLSRPIVVEDNVWIAAEAFVGPGVSIGEGVVLGARSVAFSNLKPWTIYAGNPAKPIRDRSLSGRRG